MPGIYHKLPYFHFHNMILRIIYTDILPFHFMCYHNRVFIYNATREIEGNKGSELCSLELLTWDAARAGTNRREFKEKGNMSNSWENLTAMEMKPFAHFSSPAPGWEFCRVNNNIRHLQSCLVNLQTQIWSLSQQPIPQHCKMLVFPHIEKSNNKIII